MEKHPFRGRVGIFLAENPSPIKAYDWQTSIIVRSTQKQNEKNFNLMICRRFAFWLDPFLFRFLKITVMFTQTQYRRTIAQQIKSHPSYKLEPVQNFLSIFSGTYIGLLCPEIKKVKLVVHGAHLHQLSHSMTLKIILKLVFHRSLNLWINILIITNRTLHGSNK